MPGPRRGEPGEWEWIEEMVSNAAPRFFSIDEAEHLRDDNALDLLRYEPPRRFNVHGDRSMPSNPQNLTPEPVLTEAQQESLQIGKVMIVVDVEKIVRQLTVNGLESVLYLQLGNTIRGWLDAALRCSMGPHVIKDGKWGGEWQASGRPVEKPEDVVIYWVAHPK